MSNILSMRAKGEKKFLLNCCIKENTYIYDFCVITGNILS